MIVNMFALAKCYMFSKILWHMKWVSHKKTNIVWFPLYEVSRVVIFIEKESKMLGLWVI